jgi:hypothetical protein
MNAAPYRLIVVLLALVAVAPAARAQGAPPAKPAAKPAAAPAKAAPVSAQDTSTAAAIALLRSDIRAGKITLITQALELTEAQGKVFWPLYTTYDTQAAKLGDERVALIMDFAAHYDSMTDAKALELANKAADIEERRVKLRHDQIAIMSKSLPGKLVARFVQVDAYLNKAIDLKLADELPFIKK